MDLCTLLKGHEGEIFWSDVFGLVILTKVADTYITISVGQTDINLYPDGSKIQGGRCIIFPSKKLRDWDTWAKEQEISKTWNNIGDCDVLEVIETIKPMTPVSKDNNIVKSVLTLLKINQLIEFSYGGIVSYYEFCYSNAKLYKICPISNAFMVVEIKGELDYSHIAFHTREQAEEFLSYPENVQLLKDFYMI